jgi:hypothetical protein
VLERIVPGDVRAARAFGEGADFRAWSIGVFTEVEPGEVAHVEIDDKVRSVVAGLG